MNVDLAVPSYLDEMFLRLGYTPSTKPQYSPYPFVPITYGLKGSAQTTPTLDDSPYLNKSETKWVQSALGSLLYYARALDCTMLPALNQLGTRQAQPTMDTMTKLKRLLDYAHTNPSPILRFHQSEMILHIDSDAAYLVLPKARSRMAGYFRLLNKIENRRHDHNGPLLSAGV